MNHQELLKDIENLSSEEKYKLLDELFHKYFDKRNLPKAEYNDN